MTRAYKCFTHDWRSPMQGGAPVWDGSLPYVLPTVEVDTGPAECAAGWNAAATPETALRIAGLWPGGWPVRLMEVETDATVHTRGQKLRAASWTVVGYADIANAIERLSAPFGALASEMAHEQLAWYEALGRPEHNPTSVEQGLRQALSVRTLHWHLHSYPTAWNAQRVWEDWVAWEAWEAQRAWADRVAREAWEAWRAWADRGAREAWEAWGAWADRGAREAWEALIMYYTARRAWIHSAPEILTTGLREAYHAGLAIALPTAPDTLGWAMVGAGG